MLSRREREETRDQAREYIKALSPEEKGDFLIKLYTEYIVDYRYLANVFDCDVQDIIEFLKGVNIKRCSCCKIIKSYSEFYRDNKRVDNLTSKCKECILTDEARRDYNKKHYIENREARQRYGEKYRVENREAISERNKIYRQENHDKVVQRNQIYYSSHIEEQRDRHKKYYIENRETIDKKTKVYRQKNSDKIAQYQREYQSSHIEELRDYYKEYQKKRRREDPIYRLSKCFSVRIYRSLRFGKSNIHWEVLVGYTLADLKSHLETKFDENMSWSNYGSYWEIDHIVPVAAFKFTSYNDEAFRKCWSLQNLQPLKGIDNLVKSDTISEEWNNVELAAQLL